jgi:ubiquinone/menaquinone biosynthesis C-methylase UbiE
VLAQSPGFLELRDRILEAAQLTVSDRLLDIGAGTGLLALAAAPHVAHVAALDCSQAMCRRLEWNSARLGLQNLETLAHPATSLPLADCAVDVVVSNYCFHHLDVAEKQRTLSEIRRVLRPGGRVVFADMMFDLGMRSRRDRAVVVSVVRRLLRRGPGGLVRLAKSAIRVAWGRGERPADVAWWREALHQNGFVDVVVEDLDHEGGIARARRPA